jgi:hypothetical protein
MLTKALICVGLALCVGACASTPSTPAATSPTAASPTAAKTANQPPAGCVAETATRIPVSPTECAAFGRVHTDEAIKQTGVQDTAQALRLLDPAITTKGAGGQ